MGGQQADVWEDTPEGERAVWYDSETARVEGSIP